MAVILPPDHWRRFRLQLNRRNLY